MRVVKRPVMIVSIIGLFAIILAGLFRFGFLNQPDHVKTEISSTLTEAINISDLSTAEFRYRGIAEIYDNAEKTRLRCHVCYSAIVKAGINMKDVKITDVDTDHKTISMSLPRINLKVTIIDEHSMNTLPSNANVSFDTMLKSCKEDAEFEAQHSDELFATARENLKAVIEGLTYPLLKSWGYSIVWE